MAPREILFAVEIHADPTTIFDAVATQRGQTAFWTTDAIVQPTVGSVAEFGFPGTPARLKMEVDGLEPGRRVSWRCRGEFPHWTDTRVTWEMQPAANAGETTLLFAHSGWGDEYPRDQLAHTSYTWGQIAARLKGYAETGQPQPFFDLAPQATSTPAVAFIRDAAQVSHWYLEGTMADVNAEQAHYLPPGRANPLGATYAHVLCSEDLIINGMLRQTAPLSVSTHATNTGLSEPMPMPGTPDWSVAYAAWARRVRVDLPVLKSYGADVYAATDAYLATLTDADLDRELDLSAVGLGKRKLGWMLNLLVLNHVGTETGEIAVLKGIQGAQGYPL